MRQLHSLQKYTHAVQSIPVIDFYVQSSCSIMRVTNLSKMVVQCFKRQPLTVNYNKVKILKISLEKPSSLNSLLQCHLRQIWEFVSKNRTTTALKRQQRRQQSKWLIPKHGKILVKEDQSPATLSKASIHQFESKGTEPAMFLLTSFLLEVLNLYPKVRNSSLWK